MLCSGQKIDDKVWDEVIKEVDADGNGEIDFEEFSTMMEKLLQKWELYYGIVLQYNMHKVLIIHMNVVLIFETNIVK